MDILSLIKDVGFPILMCLILMKSLNKETDSHKNEILLITESVSKISEAVENNTAAIEKLETYFKFNNIFEGEKVNEKCESERPSNYLSAK